VIGFFLRRPVFASVCSLVLLLIGLVAIPTLPIAEYPPIAPPVVTVTSTYTGASAQAVEASVTTPLEEAINGVQGLRYIASASGNDGTSTITCTFELSRNLDQATNDVQNAVNSAQGVLPNEVKQTGITVSKNAGTFIMAVGLGSTNPAHDAIFLSNYADRYIVNELKRIPGVADVRVFGERKYAMRVWLDPKRLADNGLAVSDVTSALQDQNVQVAAGSIGQEPAAVNQPYQISVRAVGRLTTPREFRNIILKANSDGAFVRIGDVGRVELGAENYSNILRFHGKTALGIGILQLPTANALSVASQVHATFNRLEKHFPSGMQYRVAFDSTLFVNESIHEVVVTLGIAITLVVLVIFLFLQDWRTTLIPAITIPVSLIGTFGLIKALGFSINTLTLFGLTLATGLVVDDAIVVLENIVRYIQEEKMAPFEGALVAMREIFGAVLATSLVLLAVFIPVAFFPGTTGQLYKQFALTIACSIAISAFNALTFTPALSALLLRPEGRQRNRLFLVFNQGLAKTRRAYDALLPRLFAFRYGVIVLFAAALLLTGIIFKSMPTAFIPDEDQGYFIMTVQLPEGNSIERTIDVIGRVEKLIGKEPVIRDVFSIGGFGFFGAGSNRGLIFAQLVPWAERAGDANSLDSVLMRVRSRLASIADAQVFAFNPPAIQGVGNFGGFQYELLDQGELGMEKMMGAAFGFMRLGNQDPVLQSVFTTFRDDTPQLVVNLDREKAKNLNIPLQSIFSTLQVDLGSFYVNDFNFLDRSYRLYEQADQQYRARIGDLQNLYVRSTAGAMIPITALVKIDHETAPGIITHYNLFRSIELNGQPAPGHGSGEAIAEMEKLSQKILPPGISYAWSGISLEQIESGGQSAFVFLLGISFVYLVLAAQYESWITPLVILLSVPLALLGALLALRLRGLQSDIFAQVGYVMLVGLASKNAILIVEFANQLQERGLPLLQAVRVAAETRLRPILMTSFAFILGILPLVLATGAGSVSRNSLGSTVFGGMLISTILNLLIVPVFYVVIEGGRRGRLAAKRRKEEEAAEA
jgi:HAE1 family hydrophobic/amphiphilic exporter-1